MFDLVRYHGSHPDARQCAITAQNSDEHNKYVPNQEMRASPTRNCQTYENGVNTLSSNTGCGGWNRKWDHHDGPLRSVQNAETRNNFNSSSHIPCKCM
jgi:hypothetical protein